MNTVNKYIDHTLLKPDIGIANLSLHCNQAITYNLYYVCVNSVHVSYVHSILDRTNIKICSTINFPLGASSSHAVCQEAIQAINDGADEIDTVINISFLKSGYTDEILKDLVALRSVTEGKVLKVIFENCLLTKQEKILACEICCEAKVDFIKTSTGFSTGGATLEDVRLMKKHTQHSAIKIKAAGGIRDYNTVLQFIEAGAMRIGTSNSIAIVTGESNAISDSNMY